jgi:hypothetical protein
VPDANNCQAQPERPQNRDAWQQYFLGYSEFWWFYALRLSRHILQQEMLGGFFGRK